MNSHPAKKGLYLLLTALLMIAPLLSAFGAPRSASAASEGPAMHTFAPRPAQPPVPEGLAQGAQPLEGVARITMPPVDTAALRREDLVRAQQGLPPRFATALPVDVTPATHGTWETLSDGQRLWRLRILSPDALSLNLGFTRYTMPQGGRLFLYTPDYIERFGPFTAADNEAHGQLWTPLLLGQEIVIEVTLPASQEAALALRLTSVNHGYDEFGKPKQLMSGSCNLDVVCGAANGFPQVEPWREEIRSAGAYSLGGTDTCSGALVNNTAQDLKPYFLTADHCGISAGNAPSMVVFWNYQNSTCRLPGSPASGGPGDGTRSQFNSGAIFRAEYGPSDFTLVEMDDPINPAYNPHWSGWDARPGDYASAVAIHHPGVEEKRISFENDATSTTAYLGTTSPGNGTHIRVADWDLGTTEGGSSGSPLFNPAQRIVGQLHGGFAACGNNDADWYGRVSVSWAGGGTNSTRLSNWLDPVGGGGTLFLDGRDAIPDFTLSATPASQAICVGQSATYGIRVGATQGFNSPVTLSASGQPAGTSATFTPNPATPPTTSTLVIGNTGSAAAGNYTIQVVGTTTTSTHTTTLSLNVATAAPAAPTLQSPGNGAGGVPNTPVLTWASAPGATGYTVQIALDAAFTNIVNTGTTATTTYSPPSPLGPNTLYYWRVIANNGCGASAASVVFSFRTVNAICRTPSIAIPDNGTVTDSFVITSTDTISDLNLSLDVDHTYIGDLIITLTKGATSQDVINRPGNNGCSGDNIDATFDDEATTPAQTSCSNTTGLTTGPYRPAEPFAAFDNAALSGTWTLTISDNAGQDVGTLNSWCLLPSPRPATAVTVAQVGSAPAGHSALAGLALGLLALTAIGLGLRRTHR